MKIYAQFTSNRQEPAHLIWPDSCWLLSDRPLYIPDFAPRFAAIPALAAKAGRLGKNVAPRFAGRYLTRWTSALIILPQSAIDLLDNGGVPPADQYCFDNAIVIGNWLLSDEIPPFDLYISNPRSSDADISLSIAPDKEPVVRALCDLTRYNTLKMGDIIMAPLPIDPIPLSERLSLRISAGGNRQSHILFTRFR